jgi:hypothetical protein
MLDVFISVWEVACGCTTVVVVCFMLLDLVLFIGNMVDTTALDTVEVTRGSAEIRQQHSFNFVGVG